MPHYAASRFPYRKDGELTWYNHLDRVPDDVAADIDGDRLLVHTASDVAGESYPAGGTVEGVVSWVGDSAERARYALDVEHSRDEPRTTLIGFLERVLGEDTHDDEE